MESQLQRMEQPIEVLIEKQKLIEEIPESVIDNQKELHKKFENLHNSDFLSPRLPY